MYEDYLAQILKNYIRDANPITEQLVKGRAKDPEYDKKVNQTFKDSLKNITVIKEKLK